MAGEAFFQDADLLTMDSESIRNIRGAKISVVFLRSDDIFQPVLTMAIRQLNHQNSYRGRKKEALERAIKYLDLVGIPNARERVNDYPHQFSGGCASG